MSEPVIVPPAPTVTQPSSPVDTSPGLEQVQKAFDRVLPAKGPQKTLSQEKPLPAAPPVPEEKPAPPPPEEKPAPPSQVDAPSFLEAALRGETPAPAAPEEEWPEELPAFKTPEESKTRYKKWRQSYNNLKEELKKTSSRPAVDPTAQARMEQLETHNKQMAETLSRFGVEQSAEFQQTIIAPLTASWHEAVRIVKDSGADPADLQKAMSLSGRAQFEALDDLFSGMPESARAEAHDALRTFRRYNEARANALQHAPQAYDVIRKRELQRQIGELNKQREDMKTIFDRALGQLRDDAKLEVFLKTDVPEAKWWNEQGEKIVEQARNLYLENNDMNRVAMACLLAPAAETFRTLWLNSQKKIGQLQKIIDERIGSEPNLSESGGSQSTATPGQQLQDDLKKPFSQVFLREFHKAQARSR